MADGSYGGYVIRVGVVVLAVAMVLFMLGRPDLYPLWTVGLIGLVGAWTLVSLVRSVTDR